MEASLNFQATDTINLFAGASYNDIKFDDYHDSKEDLSGNRTTFAPKYNFNLGALYRTNNGYYASSDMYLDRANKYKRDAYKLVNAKIGYETQDYDIYFYGKNIFDKVYNIEGHYGRYRYFSAPREMDMQLAYRF